MLAGSRWRLQALQRRLLPAPMGNSRECARSIFKQRFDTHEPAITGAGRTHSTCSMQLAQILASLHKLLSALACALAPLLCACPRAWARAPAASLNSGQARMVGAGMKTCGPSRDRSTAHISELRLSIKGRHLFTCWTTIALWRKHGRHVTRRASLVLLCAVMVNAGGI